jgi:spore coat polysaccharide biosynthesis protein SpsF
MSDAAIILQARMGSARLPGKVLRTLGRHSLLAHCLRRLRDAQVGPVVVATTREDRDREIVEEASRLGYPVFRGETDDVLARYVAAAGTLGTRYIIRATADNPTVDSEGPARLLEAVERTGAEYGLEQGLPMGAAVEVVAAETLRRLGALATHAADREHVTLYIKHNLSTFRVCLPAAPREVRRPDLRLTVDTPEDLIFMKSVIECVDQRTHPPRLGAVIAAADELLAARRAA